MIQLFIKGILLRLIKIIKSFNHHQLYTNIAGFCFWNLKLMVERRIKLEILEAYNLTFEKAFELGKYGIQVEHFPYKCEKSEDEDSELPQDHWGNIVFTVQNSDQGDKVFELKTFLFLQGIFFDSGAFLGGPELQLDWQIDWSFHLYDLK